MNFNLTPKGYKQPLQLRVLSSDILIYGQIFLLKEYDFVVTRTPEVIVDAGANIGLASVYFAHQYPTTKIIAIEPEQSNFELLQKNVAAYPNITPVQAALWHENTEIHLIDPKFGKWAFRTASKESSQIPLTKTCHTVMGMTVAKLMQTYGLEKIDILKIDIEGAEKEVFSDTSVWINSVDALITELHERMKAGCRQSFYNGAKGFDNEWKQGENIYMVKGDFLQKRVKL